MRLFVIALSMLLSFPALAQYQPCEKYRSNRVYARAIELTAQRLGYTTEQLCRHPRILDIYVDRKNLTNPQTLELEMHLWVTLHYQENYSCQYFIREADQFFSKQNCYNTF